MVDGVEEDGELHRPTVVTFGDMLDDHRMDAAVSGEQLAGIVIGLSGGAVIAICGAIVMWLRVRGGSHKE